MEIEMRKVESYSVVTATSPVKLNVEDFRVCNPPFEGETENDFMNYFYLKVEWIEDFMEENKDVLSEETMSCLEQLAYPEMEEMFDSRNKGEDSWYEIGKTNPEYRRTNGFQVTVSGNNQNIFI